MTFLRPECRRLCRRSSALALLFVLTAVPVLAQSALTIRPGGTLTVTNGTLQLSGDLTTEGTMDATSGTVRLVGDAAQTIGPGPGSTLQALVVDKDPSSAAQLADTVAVTDSVLVLGGDLNLNGKQIDLGQTGGLRETTGNTVTGPGGTITATRFLNAPNAVNVGGLGARITSDVNMSATVVTRGHGPQSGTSLNEGIARYYDIAPGINSNLDATLEFFYDESELNGRDERTLALWRSADDGATYAEVGGTVVASADVIALSGIDAFSRWTATSDDAPLPVELAAFTATPEENGVVLNWRTLSESGSASFAVERRSSQASWTTVKTIPAAGTTDRPHTYRVTDDTLPFTASSLQYRLRQVDLDGTTTHTDAVTVHRRSPSTVTLHGNAPNPVRSYTTLRYTLPRTMHVRITVFDVLGREVRQLVNRRQTAGRKSIRLDASSVPSGLYFYRLRTDTGTHTRRFSVVR